MNPCRTEGKRDSVCGPPKTGIGILRRHLHVVMHVKNWNLQETPLLAPTAYVCRISRSFFAFCESARMKVV
jgi:hypothetical protein